MTERKSERFTFRVSPEDREIIKQLAEAMKRKPSNAIRFLILSAYNDMRTKQVDQVGRTA